MSSSASCSTLATCVTFPVASGRELQRVEKTLQDAGIKLSSVASEVLGVSARRMLDALISGTNDPELLAELAKGTLRRKIPALRQALKGRFTGHHALLVSQMLAQIDFLDETIATLSEPLQPRAGGLGGRARAEPRSP